ncbi:UNVERIFIED_CONTAM: hypothetical protein RMT77_014106 [Armadillidium vulgare]
MDVKDIKFESEVKVEELDFEYDSYQQCSQNPSGSEANFSFAGVKIEELDEKESIKSELTESVKESILDEELVRNDDTKSKNLAMFEKKSSAQLFKNLVSDAGEIETGSKVKNTSISRDQKSVTLDENIKKSHLENLVCKFCNISFKSEDELKSHLKTHDKKFICPHCSYDCKFNYECVIWQVTTI